jgi:hypothetical protein
MPEQKTPVSGAFRLASLMYFCSGEPMHFCSGVDTAASISGGWSLGDPEMAQDESGGAAF